MRGEERREGWCRGGGGGGASPLQVARPSVCVPVRPPKQQRRGGPRPRRGRARTERRRGRECGGGPPPRRGRRPPRKSTALPHAVSGLALSAPARAPPPPPTPHLNPPLFMSSIDWATPAGAGAADGGGFSPPREAPLLAGGAPSLGASAAAAAGPACHDPRWPAAPHDDAHPLYASDDFRIHGFKVRGRGRGRRGVGGREGAEGQCMQPPPISLTPPPRSFSLSRPLSQVVACAKAYQHDYTTCPFAHPGEWAFWRGTPRARGACRGSPPPWPRRVAGQECVRGPAPKLPPRFFLVFLSPSRPSAPSFQARKPCAGTPGPASTPVSPAPT